MKRYTVYDKQTGKPISIHSCSATHPHVPQETDAHGVIEGEHYAHECRIDHTTKTVRAHTDPPRQKTWIERRCAAYGDVGQQLDMLYEDMMNGTTKWRDHITRVKAEHPKPLPGETDGATNGP